MDSIAKLTGSMSIERHPDGSGGNLNVEGTLTAGTIAGLTFETSVTGDGATVDFHVAHTLGTKDVDVSLFEEDGSPNLTTWVGTSATQLVLRFARPPARGKVYRVILRK